MSSSSASASARSSPTSTLPPNLVGGAWIFVSAIAFALMMTLVKFLGGGYAAAVQSTYRQIASLAVMAPYMIRNGRQVFHTPKPALLTFTMALSTLGLVLGMYSYQSLPFANANALSFSRTLWMVPLAALALREPIGWARSGAAIAGFLGVLVMLRPTSGMHVGQGEIAALAAALITAGVIICMKTLLRTHSLSQIMSWAATVGLVFSLIPAVFVWRWPGPVDLALLLAMGVLGIATQAAYMRGVAVGEAAAVVPVDYSRLILTAGLGWLLFSEVPSVTTVLGGAIVILSTLFLGWHEMRSYRTAGAVMTSAD